ncbi:conserved Plasmodium protein, unknown function [Plasmodium berghei]|uniref:Uncharacterized protein n=2 Tax=Plasmodium berghei TaxID=5821 RepID=A0A509ABI2_PLABA|nr:conserved Plasmodium protein, unknown function [Plasmodium berghei ANKA]CXH80187.1 conserved Plasmodium protein, unknown function [Plasmodium berghei]SCM19014.1 conserved Plasmodium protein, unknown function [Plasmodium berghei]SCN21546.1 conserved Plasmodium protein, unknown function [Plasmodium berghei]SCO58786.1 conserved Plasmodium protein, unknown function [Plasmodium berghei]SCO58820.1 conserved Plasmodium protein, unknown function [Plasmodium berghei]|eukprot:XP_034419628.1 conserved Plasmodium protein, unknown function [Plasmodium berghei ANKA]
MMKNNVIKRIWKYENDYGVMYRYKNSNYYCNKIMLLNKPIGIICLDYEGNKIINKIIFHNIHSSVKKTKKEINNIFDDIKKCVLFNLSPRTNKSNYNKGISMKKKKFKQIWYTYSKINQDIEKEQIKQKKEKTVSFNDGGKSKNLFCLNNMNYFNSNCVEKIQIRTFTHTTNIPLKNDNFVNISKLSFIELLDYLNKNLEKNNDTKIWDNIFIQIYKLISKKKKNEYKEEIDLFFQKLNNFDYYTILNNLKYVDENTKNEILKGIFFECFVLNLWKRDITYYYGSDKAVSAYILGNVKKNDKSRKENNIQNDEKNEDRTNDKSYINNILNIKFDKNKEISKEEDMEKQTDERKISQENIDQKRIENINSKNEKNVKIIKKWLILSASFSSNCENMIMLKNYLNKIFRQNIDNLIEIDYFSKTTKYLENQINSKTMHSIIFTYENKLELMKPYDLSFSLFILQKFLILNYNIFNKIVDYIIYNPLNKFQIHQNFINFMKSVESFIIGQPQTLGKPIQDNINLYHISNRNKDENNIACAKQFQNSMNNFYNTSFLIFIKKINLIMHNYSLENLLFLSECMQNIIFMASTQNQIMNMFINKLRYNIDKCINLNSSDNYTLIRLYKIFSVFSFVPEIEYSCQNSFKDYKINPKHNVNIEEDNYVNNNESISVKNNFFDEEKKDNIVASELDEQKKIINKSEKNSKNNNEDEKINSEKKNISKNREDTILNGKDDINYLNTFIRDWDLVQIYDNTISINKDLLDYNKNYNINRRNSLLKNVVAILCSRMDINLDEIKIELNKIKISDSNRIYMLFPDKKDTVYSFAKSDINIDILINEIKKMNDNNADKDIYRENSKNDLQNEYLFFYNIKVLSDIFKFSQFSVNTNSHTYDIIKCIKKKLEEIAILYSINKSEMIEREKSGWNENKKSNSLGETHKIDKDKICSEIKNISLFHLYNFYCSCKNYSPPFILKFADSLIKITPKINIVHLDNNNNVISFNEQNICKIEYAQFYEEITKNKIINNTIMSFIVPLLQTIKIIISSNLFLKNNALNEYVNVMAHYSYFVLFYYYYNSNKYEGKIENPGEHIWNNAHEEKQMINNLKTDKSNKEYTEINGYNNARHDRINDKESGIFKNKGNIIDSHKNYTKKICIFENLYLEDIWNIYICLSICLHFLNKTEEKTNGIQHLAHLEKNFLEIISKKKYMKYVSDNFVFYLFKTPFTNKLEETFDNAISSLKINNLKKYINKNDENISSQSYSQNEKVLSLPAFTAFFLCKTKLAMQCNNMDNPENIERVENCKKIFEILINDYKMLENCIEHIFTSHNNLDENMNTHNNSTQIFRRTEVENKRNGKENIFNNFSNKSKNYYLPYMVSNKVCVNKNIYFKASISDMFFGAHKIKTLYNLQNTLLNTVKYIETTQININVNYKLKKMQPFHNNILSYLFELSNIVKSCLYSTFLSQPYIHKSPKKYVTNGLVNYFINNCRLLNDGNIYEKNNPKLFNGIRNYKYLINKLHN